MTDDVKDMKERLIEFIKQAGISIREFERNIGAANGYVNGITKGISADRLHTIGRLYPTLNTEWLLTGEGTMLRSENNTQHTEATMIAKKVIEGIMEYSGLSAPTLASRWGMTAQAVYDMLRGKTTRISPRLRAIIARDMPEIDTQWLLTGEGAMLRGENNTQQTEQTVKDRTLDFIRAQRLRVSEFERICGLGTGYVSTIRKGFGADNLQKVLAAFPNLNRDWLLYGEGTMLRNDTEEEPRRLPLIPFDALAGTPTEDNSGITLNDCELYAVPDFIGNGAQYLIRVSGDSMQPQYNNGDIVAIRKLTEVTFFQWGKTYLIDTNQGALIKQLYEDTENSDNVICHSINSSRYPDFKMHKNDIRSLSIIVGFIHLE